MESTATLAGLSGWPIVAVFALMLLIGALVENARLVVLSVVVLEALLVLWVYAIGWLTTG
jgi:hypothetical protein